MNRKINILIALTALLFTGCADLEYTEANDDRNEAWIYANPLTGVRGMVNDVYAQMFNQFKLIDNDDFRGALLASATDEAVFATALSDIHKYTNGGWTPSNPFPNTWQDSYTAIYEIHTYLEKIDQINLDEYKYDSNYTNMVRQFGLFPYELRFLRAYFYFELARAYGDVPLVTTTLTEAEANSVYRTPVQDVFRFIVEECDAIAEFLPYSYMNEPDQQIGRASRPAVLALKARTLLYAASPLFNKDNDRELWKEAAVATKELLDKAAGWGIILAPYTAHWGHDTFTRDTELIMGLGQGNSQNFERFNYPTGVENGSSGNCPSQSLVDMYEYKATGKSFKETFPGASINITQENPYEGLDPRFALSVVKNGDNWPTNTAQGAPMEIYAGGFNGSPKYGATPTGYYLRKFVNGNTVTTVNNQTSYRHTWIVFRLAEFYLNYAEAMYNYYDNADAQGDLGMSANEAINVLRDREDIEMPHFSGSAGFEERYMRERAVELAFEDHRFWDVRRWMKGADYFDEVGVANLIINGEGDLMLNRATQTRVWDEAHNFYPIPQSEIQKNGNLEQNDGWL